MRWRANFFKDLVIARALIGKTKGATVEVEAPGGAKFYKIQQMEWLEDSPKRRE
jgi:hypothetical protein